MQAVLRRLEPSPAVLRRTFLATILHHWQRQDLPPQALLRILPRSKRDPDILRLTAVTLERADWSGAVELWDEYVTAAIEAGVLPATGPELSRDLAPHGGIISDRSRGRVGCFRCRVRGSVATGHSHRPVACLFRPRCIIGASRGADPDSQVFRALVAHYDQRQPKRAEAAAVAWRRAHPQDLEPLLYLIRVAEGRGAVRKALALLAEAESINQVHPEVRQSRFRLLLAGAERRIAEGKLTLALSDLDRLEQEPRAGEGDHRAYLLALRWAVAHKAADAPTIAQLEQTLRTSVGNSALHELILGTVARSFGIEAPKPLGRPARAEAIEGLTRGCDLFRALNRPLIVPPALLAQVEKGLNTASVAQLHALCMGGLWIANPALTYAASSYGLAQDGSLMHRFLLVRGQALKATPSFEEQARARQCLRAARELAGRARDMDAVREASAALQTLSYRELAQPVDVGQPHAVRVTSDAGGNPAHHRRRTATPSDAAFHPRTRAAPAASGQVVTAAVYAGLV